MPGSRDHGESWGQGGLGEMREEAATVTLVPETKAGEESGWWEGRKDRCLPVLYSPPLD